MRVIMVVHLEAAALAGYPFALLAKILYFSLLFSTLLYFSLHYSAPYPLYRCSAAAPAVIRRPTRFTPFSTLLYFSLLFSTFLYLIRPVPLYRWAALALIRRPPIRKKHK